MPDEESLAEALTHFHVSIYVSVASLSFLLYDHFLTFADEVEYVWKARMTLPKALFLFSRYAVPMTCIISLHAFSGISGDVLSHKAWLGMSISIGAMSIASSNFIVLLRLWVVWERHTTLVISTLAVFVVSQLVTLGMLIWAIVQSVPLAKSVFLGVWAPGVLFEVMIMITLWWNAFDRPRTSTKALATELFHDGLCLVGFELTPHHVCTDMLGNQAMRVLNMVLAVVAPNQLAQLPSGFVDPCRHLKAIAPASMPGHESNPKEPKARAFPDRDCAGMKDSLCITTQYSSKTGHALAASGIDLYLADP
ncbi:hypothetical protein OF83DRAFT_1084803 [Amylostereum chailletii]|nr:hypothetical protein OF83DRAFT_1084803 [Amylostereum chailletii]